MKRFRVLIAIDVDDDLEWVVREAVVRGLSQLMAQLAEGRRTSNPSYQIFDVSEIAGGDD